MCDCDVNSILKKMSLAPFYHCATDVTHWRRQICLTTYRVLPLRAFSARVFQSGLKHSRFATMIGQHFVMHDFDTPCNLDEDLVACGHNNVSCTRLTMFMTDWVGYFQTVHDSIRQRNRDI